MSFLTSLSEKKRDMGLPCPGPFENLHKEARGVSLTHYLFEGGKLDLAKVFGNNFQLSHSFNLGSSAVPPSYNFGTVFVGAKHFMQGMIDNKGDLQGKYSWSVSDDFVAKAQVQVSPRPGYSMCQLEGEYSGRDWTANAKAINVDVSRGTGIFTGSFLQSVTKNLALGIEGVLQRPNADIEEAGMTLVGRYAFDKDCVATVSLQNLLGVHASFYRRVTPQLELAAECQAMVAGPHSEALASVSGKWDYHQASVRAQIDSAAKMAVVVEERLMGRMALLISGEIDHLKGRSKFGVGLSIEN